MSFDYRERWVKNRIEQHKEVTNYCSWVKTRFDNLIEIASLRIPTQHLTEPEMGAIESWVEVGNSNYKEETEWQNLYSYIYVKMTFFIFDLEEENIKNAIIKNMIHDMDQVDEILKDEDPLVILGLDYNPSNPKVLHDVFLIALNNLIKSTTVFNAKNNSQKLLKIFAAYADVYFTIFSKSRKVTEQEFVRLLGNPPQKLIDLAKNGGEVQNGDEFLTIEEGEKNERHN